MTADPDGNEPVAAGSALLWARSPLPVPAYPDLRSRRDETAR